MHPPTNALTISQVSETLEDLVEKAAWVQQHPAEATKIAEAGRRLAENHLTLVNVVETGPGAPRVCVTVRIPRLKPNTVKLQEAVQCYVVYLLEQFGKLQAFAPRRFLTDITETKSSRRSHGASNSCSD